MEAATEVQSSIGSGTSGMEIAPLTHCLRADNMLITAAASATRTQEEAQNGTTEYVYITLCSATRRSFLSRSQEQNTGKSEEPPNSAMMRSDMTAAPNFSDSPNARSKTVTTALGPDTHGVGNYLCETEMSD